MPLAGAVLLYADGSRLREIPGQLGALVLFGIFLCPLFLAINYPVETFYFLIGLGSLVVEAASR